MPTVPPISLLLKDSGSKPRKWYHQLLSYIFTYKLMETKKAAHRHTYRSPDLDSPSLKLIQADSRLGRIELKQTLTTLYLGFYILLKVIEHNKCCFEVWSCASGTQLFPGPVAVCHWLLSGRGLLSWLLLFVFLCWDLGI